MTILNRHCRECGTAYEARRETSEFCSVTCRKSWHNRRMLRGVELYDLFMAYRYNRAAAKALGLFALMCRMAMVWKREDGLRQSYMDPAAAVERLRRYRAD